MTTSASIPTAVISRWSRFANAKFQPINTGLINLTVKMQLADETAILQRLHPIFSPKVNLDIAAVTAHLSAKGLITPKLLPTDDGALWVENDDGVWRVLSFISGHTHTAITSQSMAYQAGYLVGTVHAALADFNYTYQSDRNNVHDTKVHLTRLTQTIANKHEHRLYSQVAPLATQLLRQAETIADFKHLPLRHAHGDLKISNLIFNAAEEGVALIDLDTLTRMHWPLEMGDALRSWCNPRREDERPVHIEVNLFKSAIAGYKESTHDLITKDEWVALIPGLARICLELSSRFLADALNESYFGWDNSRYPARGEHNLARGLAMWDLYLDVINNHGSY